MSPRSASKSVVFHRRYLTALKKYLARTPGTTLRTAEMLGRQAVTAGIGTSALATVHKKALTLVQSGAPTRTTRGKIARASNFFVAVLKPAEETRGGTAAPTDHLSRLQQTRRRSTLELSGTQRQLKRGLAQRKALEVALGESKRKHSQLLKEALRAQKHLRRLSLQVLSAQEQERKRISRELHDEIGQIPTAARNCS